VAFVDGDWFADAREASLPVLDHGLLYGDGVFEGIRFYVVSPSCWPRICAGSAPRRER
jgi:branched-subunit amino acid aminotransferase/4-amino-4-deoxychorismate lyase